MRGLLGRHARLARPGDLRFRGDAVAERERDPRLQHARRLVVRIGLERVQQFHPRGADVAALERGGAALIRRALLPEQAARARASEPPNRPARPSPARLAEARAAPGKFMGPAVPKAPCFTR